MEAELKTLVYTALGTFGDEQGLFVSFPNRNDKALDNLKKDDDFTSYLRGSVMPVKPNVKGIKSGWAIYTWLFQVSVYIRDGLGEIIPSETADLLRQAFPYNTKFQGQHEYTIVDVGEPTALVPNGTWPFIPVTFRLISAS